MVADALAKAASSSSIRGVWRDVPPSFIMGMFVKDFKIHPSIVDTKVRCNIIFGFFLPNTHLHLEFF